MTPGGRRVTVNEREATADSPPVSVNGHRMTGIEQPATPGEREASLHRVVARIGVVTRDFAASGAYPFKAYELGRGPMNLLFALSRSDGSSVSELADGLRVTSSAVSQTVDALRAVGLVTSETNPSDRRSRIIRLTDAARLEVDQFQRAYFDGIAPRFDALSVAEIVELDRILSLLRDPSVGGLSVRDRSLHDPSVRDRSGTP